MGHDFINRVAVELSKGRVIEISPETYINGSVDIRLRLIKTVKSSPLEKPEDMKIAHISARELYEYGLDGAYTLALDKLGREMDKRS